MTFKFLKAGLVSLLISVSGFANADIILFEWDSTDGDKNLVWTLDTGQVPDTTEADFSEYIVAYEYFGQGSFFGLDDGLFRFYNEIGGGGVYLNIDELLSEDLIGEPVYTGTLASPVFVAGYFEFGMGDSGMPTSILTISELTEVPEPTALAILALGIIGLSSRRFKKQA